MPLAALCSSCGGPPQEIVQSWQAIGPERQQAARELYQQRCATCHGADGHGDGPSARAMQPPPRDFTSASWQNDFNDEQLRQAIVNGVAGAAMPPHPDLRSSQQLDDLILYLRTWQGE